MPLLTVANNVYDYPDPGTEPGWGEEATSWAEAVTEVLNTLLAPGDILETSFAIANNISVNTNVNGLAFDNGTIRAANITYAVYRESDANPSGNSESGIIQLTFDNAAAPGSKWIVAIQNSGGAGVTFTCTDAGQVQYKSTDIGTAGYSGQMKFSAKTLSQ